MENKKLIELLDILNELYPEKKIFALGLIDEHLRERIKGMSLELGFSDVEDFYKEYGFSSIKFDKINEIRNEVKYTPGNEPTCFKKYIKSVIERLDTYYPDKVINNNIKANHKKLGENISGVSAWLGYSDIISFLVSYGYNVIEIETSSKGGRPSIGYENVFEEIKKRYPTGAKFKTAQDFIAANPDLSQRLNTLKKDAKKVLGMSFGKYLETIGILDCEDKKYKAFEKMKNELLKKEITKKNHLQKELKELNTELAELLEIQKQLKQQEMFNSYE